MQTNLSAEIKMFCISHLMSASFPECVLVTSSFSSVIVCITLFNVHLFVSITQIYLRKRLTRTERNNRDIRSYLFFQPRRVPLILIPISRLIESPSCVKILANEILFFIILLSKLKISLIIFKSYSAQPQQHRYRDRIINIDIVER